MHTFFTLDTYSCLNQAFSQFEKYVIAAGHRFFISTIIDFFTELVKMLNDLSVPIYSLCIHSKIHSTGFTFRLKNFFLKSFICVILLTAEVDSCTVKLHHYGDDNNQMASCILLQ